MNASDAHVTESIEMGYPFECTCGEHHRTAASAIHCRKCRVYAEGEPRTATDLRTGETLSFSDVFPPQPVDPRIEAQLAEYFANLS